MTLKCSFNDFELCFSGFEMCFGDLEVFGSKFICFFDVDVVGSDVYTFSILTFLAQKCKLFRCCHFRLRSVNYFDFDGTCKSEVACNFLK